MDFNNVTGVQITIVNGYIELIETVEVEDVVVDNDIIKFFLPFGWLNIDKKDFVWDEDAEEYHVGQDITIELIE